jgi:hypothetical protein
MGDIMNNHKSAMPHYSVTKKAMMANMCMLTLPEKNAA